MDPVQASCSSHTPESRTVESPPKGAELTRRSLLVVPLLFAVTAALSGCSLANAINPPISSAIYATVADAAGANSSVAVPAWVPADATIVRMKTDVSRNTKIMTFVAAQPAVAADAPAGTVAPTVAAAIGGECDAAISANRPTLDDSWWIQEIAPDAAISCVDNWHVIIDGLRVYAWTP